FLAALRRELPIATKPYLPGSGTLGLVIVDEVNGFCTVGAGNLAPPKPDKQVANMVRRTDQFARDFLGKGRPVLAFLDTHEPGVPEPPYPPHCERGTGEEDFVAELEWLERHPDVTLVRKNCINGFVGSIEIAPKGHGLSHNRCVDWINVHGLSSVVVVGICTDICVMDFVLTLLSARNHHLTPTLKDVVVMEPACATFDLPRAQVEDLSLPHTAAHPKEVTHHMGLYFMASRGAIISESIVE
ncbi:MAG: isochorismatase family protein, partial [Pseudomonadota bacterium]